MGPGRRLTAAVLVATAAATLAACTGDGPHTARSTPAAVPSGTPTAARTTQSPSAPTSSTTTSSTTAPTTAGKDRTARVARPRSPGQAARALTWAESAIAHPATPAAELRRAARQQQLAYRALGEHPGWDGAVLAAVPRSLHGVVRDNVAARREFRAMHVVLSDSLPAWRIVPPAPAERLLRDYRRGQRAYGIGWEYLAAVNLVETGMGRIRGTSTAGAQGPMQFLPSTWATWGRGDIDDPDDAIMAAARYLAHDGGARPGGMERALYRYNNSEHYVRGVTLLAKVMQRRPRAFYGYYNWDVYYLTTRGDVRLPVGYDRDRPVPVARWLEAHPQR